MIQKIINILFSVRFLQAVIAVGLYTLVDNGYITNEMMQVICTAIYQVLGISVTIGTIDSAATKFAGK